jgi:chloramphenicol-sensitive protein RarD
MSQHRIGVTAGLLSYVIWGLFPLFWPLVEPAGALEILAHRILWSLAFLVVVLALTAGFRWLRTVGRRRLLLLCAAAALITVNWGVFIYAVNNDHVVDSALGYYINPLVSVALGLLVLHEHLRPRQRIAVLIGLLAVVVLTIEYGKPPWIALILACSFGTYGLVKKQVGLDGTQSLFVETAILVVPALAFIVVTGLKGTATFTADDLGHSALLMAGGVVTAVPLILFGAAAIRIPLSTIGLMQYIAPTMHFVIGVAIYGEAMPAGRVAGFVLVWIALIVLTVDALGTLRPRNVIPSPVHARVRPATPPDA